MILGKILVLIMQYPQLYITLWQCYHMRAYPLIRNACSVTNNIMMKDSNYSSNTHNNSNNKRDVIIYLPEYNNTAGSRLLLCNVYLLYSQGIY